MIQGGKEGRLCTVTVLTVVMVKQGLSGLEQNSHLLRHLLVLGMELETCTHTKCSTAELCSTLFIFSYFELPRLSSNFASSCSAS